VSNDPAPSSASARSDRAPLGTLSRLLRILALLAGPGITIAGLWLTLAALIEAPLSATSLLLGLFLAGCGIAYRRLAPRWLSFRGEPPIPPAALNFVEVALLALLIVPVLGTAVLYPGRGSALLGLAWFGYLLPAAVALLLVRCPSCARPFFRKDWGVSLSSRCAHCKRRLRAGPA
jgi:hypothetical protein